MDEESAGKSKMEKVPVGDEEQEPIPDRVSAI